MKLNDAVWGALLLLLGAAVLVHVQAFPTIPGQQVGPALFPGLVAAGLGVCGVLLIVKGLRRRAAASAPWSTLRRLDALAAPRRRASRSSIGVNVAYILLVDDARLHARSAPLYLLRAVRGASACGRAWLRAARGRR